MLIGSCLTSHFENHLKADAVTRETCTFVRTKKQNRGLGSERMKSSPCHQIQYTWAAWYSLCHYTRSRRHLNRQKIFVNRWFSAMGVESPCSLLFIVSYNKSWLGIILSSDSKADMLANLKGENNSTSTFLEWVLDHRLKNEWSPHIRSWYLLWLCAP